MKGNESNFPFISFQQFFRIGTFQWVADDSNKKIFRSICGCVWRAERLRAWSSPRVCASSFYPHVPAPRSAIEFAIVHDPSCGFGFTQENVEPPEPRAGPRPPRQKVASSLALMALSLALDDRSPE